MIRVVVAEDSSTVRELLVGILELDPEIRVIGQAKDGAEAVELVASLKPDLVTMDVHMPVMDGFEATKQIMIRAPTPIVIVSSSTSQREVELSLNAMRAGALTAVGKPDNPGSSEFETRSAHLVSTIKAMAQVKVVRRWAHPPLGTRAARGSRPGTAAATRLVAVAASTGGPAVLQQILSSLSGDFPVPIVVVQHVAVGFVAGLADWLNGSCNLHVKVAEQGERLERRTVYFAPDGLHLGVSGDARVALADSPPVNGFRPSGTYLFESAARAYGSALVAVILTGMGTDGVAGLRAVKSAGGRVIAQDEASSVVYGMPGEAVRSGVADTVLPIEEIAVHLTQLSGGGAANDASTHPRR